MIKNKNILAVVPARGGSKGVPRKNIRELYGTPLVGLVGNVLKDLPEIDCKVISTDDDEIGNIGKEFGIDFPFKRPESLSGDRIGDLEVLTQALEEMEKQNNIKYDIVLMLQPTSPSRKASHVLDCVNKLIDGNFDSVWTVSETDSKAHPFKQLTIEGDKLDYYDQRGKKIIARQQLTPVYHRNGVAYAITRECLLEQKSIMGQKSSAVIIDGYCANIDVELDFELAEFFASKGMQ